MMHPAVSHTPPLGPNLSPRRMRTIQRRRRSLLMAGGLAIVVIVAVVAASLGSSPDKATVSGATSTSTTTNPSGKSSTTGSVAAPAVSGHGRHTTASGLPAAESGLLPWQLAQPISREVVAPGSAPGSVVVAGGLTASSATTGSAVSVAVPAGTSTPAGTLATATHDAAGAVLAGRLLVFGGGVQASFATVQSLPLAAGGAGAPPSSTTVGQLPQARSDAAAVTVGRTAYVIGGYDGTRADPQVLATTNGSTFHVVGTLPDPVRYPAATALGHDIYVFGGQQVGGAGAAVTDVQLIDTSTGTIRVVGHLPQALFGASAVVLGGVIYVAGGSTGAGDSGVIYAFDTKHDRALVAGHLITPVSNAAVAAVGTTAWLMGGETGTTPTAAVQMLEPNVKFGVAGKPGAGSPYYGQKLLIADRGNNRMLVLDDTGATIWSYPSATMPPPPGPKGFYFPDDTFFAKHGTEIISNQEENETIVILGYPSGKLLWSYGHPAQIGSAPGYLHEPDDAYLLKNGNISVADADNCRILFISPAGSVLNQIGTTGSCVHNPPTGVGGPNGDTPLADGNVLVSEVQGSYISEYTPSGSLVWTTHLAIAYPSDPQQLGPDLYMCADYSNPGGIVEFNRAGQILYTYRDSGGLGRLNQPSLAELVPSGVFMVNDDYRDRMIAIDPTTQATVWDYGVPDQPGTAPGLLNTPDGFDLLNPDGSTPTHPYTG
jgi:PQQ-like domain/Kelch motif